MHIPPTGVRLWATEPAASILASLSLTTGFERSVLAGVYSYMLPNCDWTIYVVNPDEPGEGIPAGVTVDAVIGRFSGAYGDAVQQLNVPTVITSSGILAYPDVPRVVPDNDWIGRTAAAALLLLGVKHFAYVGAPMAFAAYRLDGFRAALAEAGQTAHVYPAGDSEAGWWEPQVEHVGLRDWIKRLPKPVGVFCARDLVALGVTEVCKQEKIEIPGELALIGVDNDDLICGMCDPPLTSIISPAQEIGFRAAATIDHWLRGRPPTSPRVTVAHAGVAERESTRVSHISDPVVKAAIRYIDEHVQDLAVIDDLVAAIGVPRRTLERKFRTSLDRSVHDEIRRCRVEHAKRLLVVSDLPLKLIARRSGFATQERFFVVFREAAGETPHAYRVKFRTETPAGSKE